jgi:hypothetical protein
VGARRSAVLARPALHVLLACLSAGAFVWPFLTADSAFQVVAELFDAWAVAIVALFVLSRAREEGDDQGGDSGV